MSYYGKKIGWIDCSINYGRDHIKEFCRIAKPYRTVLDIGAGNGHDLIIAREEQPTASFSAIEANANCRDRLLSQGLAVHNLNMERERLPFTDSSVDLIITNQFLEHTKELFWVFHEVTRVLALGGKLIIGVPNLASLHNRLLVLVGQSPTSLRSNSAHVRGFTKPDILDFVNSIFPVGYRLLQFRGSNFYPFPPFVARPLATLFPTLAWGVFFLFQKYKTYTREFLDAPIRQSLETNFYIGEE